MDLHARVVLLFSGAGGLAGLISGFLSNAWLALGLALLFFYLIYKQAPRILGFQPSEYHPLRAAKSGFFPLFVTWLIVWVFSYTLLLTG
jgi:hypothetical protein